MDKELADLLEKLAKYLREHSKPNPFPDVRWDELYDSPKSRPLCEACRNGGICMCYQPQWDSPICKS
jgi:hypothetical protein